MKYKRGVLMIGIGAVVALGSPAFAQSSVTMYGILDTFIGYQSATVNGSHKSLLVLGNNGELTSRIGFLGSEDIGGGRKIVFQLENGFDPGTGKEQNPYRFFDRQAWIGASTEFGQLRIGRQNSTLFTFVSDMDAFGGATYGSGYLNFTNFQARVDNDISYFTPTWQGTQLQLHYSVGGVPGNVAGNAVYQVAARTLQGPILLEGAYLNATNQANTNRIQQVLFGGNYNYGRGRIYLGYFRANTIISATGGSVLFNNAGKYDPSVGPVSGTPGNYHSTYSVSADFAFSPAFSIGAGYAYTHDSSGLGNSAQQYGAIVNYDLSKQTRIYAVGTRLNNFHQADYQMLGASVTAGSFLLPDHGKSETGAQIGIWHLF
jgi:predicted porin